MAGQFDDLIPGNENRQKGGGATSSPFADLIPKPKKGLIQSGIDSVQRKAGQLAAGAGRSLEDLGIDTGLKQWGNDVAQANAAEVNSIGDIAGSPGTFLAETVGETGVDIGTTVAGSAAGERIGRAAQPLLARAPGPLKLLAPLAPAAGGIIGSVLPNFAQTYGGIRQQQDEVGQSDITRALGAAAASAALERATGIEGAAIRATKGLGGEIGETILGRAAQGAVRGGLTEGATELLQNPIEQYGGFQDPLTADSLAETAFAGIKGAAGGSVVGGAIGAIAPEAVNPVGTPGGGADTLGGGFTDAEQEAFEQARAGDSAAGPDLARLPAPTPQQPFPEPTGPISRAVNAGAAAGAPLGAAPAEQQSAGQPQGAGLADAVSQFAGRTIKATPQEQPNIAGLLPRPEQIDGDVERDSGLLALPAPPQRALPYQPGVDPAGGPINVDTNGTARTPAQAGQSSVPSARAGTPEAKQWSEQEMARQGISPQQDAQPEQPKPTLAKSGEPFKTEVAAKAAIRLNKGYEGMEVTKVPGGFGLVRPLPPAQPEPQGRQSFADPDKVERANLEQTFIRKGVAPAMAREMAQDPDIRGAQVDDVTGAFDGRVGGMKTSTVKRAVEHAVKTGEPSVFVSTDIFNLGGLNEFHGNKASKANKDFRGLTDIALSELRKTGGDVIPMRTGGDELGYVVVNASVEEVNAALDRAHEAARAYAERSGFANVPSKKEGRQHELGVGFHFGVAPISDKLSVEEILDLADNGVNLSKNKGNANVEGSPAQAPEAGASGERPGGAGEGVAGAAERTAAEGGPAAGADGRGAGDRGQRPGSGSEARGEVPSAERLDAQPGKLEPLPGSPRVRGFTGPDPRLVAVAEQYARDNGIELRRQAEYVKADPERGARIAAAYEAMQHAPQDSAVRAAYDDLIRQTTEQYRALEAAGYRFWFIDIASDAGQEYSSTPWNAMRDIRANQQMGVFPTTEGFGSEGINVDDNPLLGDTGIQWPFGGPDGPMKPVLANDLFRAVHDAFGHGLEGSGFRADGEENAWQAHVRLFTGPAVGAITSETRGQNSWLNFGPYGETNRNAKVEDTTFAQQKTGLMPEWTWQEGRAPDMPQETKNDQQVQFSKRKRPDEAGAGRAARGARPTVRKGKGKSFSDRPVQPDAVSILGRHYSNTSGLSALDGRYYGTGYKGAEWNRLQKAKPEQKAIKSRIYFYVEGTPLAARGEMGVGRADVINVQLDNLYDANRDPRNLVDRLSKIKSRDAFDNAFEQLIIDEGFDGMVVDTPGREMVVLLGTKPVPLEGDGSVRLSRTGAGAPAGGRMRADALRKTLGRITKDWGIEVKVVDSTRYLPDHIRNAPGFQEDGVDGVIDGQSIYIVANMIDSPADALRVLAHEGVGHFGMEGMLGDKFADVMNDVLAMRDRGEMAEIFEEVYSRYSDGEGGYNADDATIAKEAIAIMAEKGVKNGVMSRVMGALRSFLRSLGFKMNFNEGDLRRMIADASLYVRTGGRRADGGVQFSSGERQYKLDIEREDRARKKVAALSAAERDAVMSQAKELGLTAAQTEEILATARDQKKAYPASAGWANIELVGIEVKRDDEDQIVGFEPNFKAVAYGYNIPPGKSRAPNKIDEKWARKVADKFRGLIEDIYARAEKGDKNAQIIIGHQTWYRNVAEVLRREYGANGDLLSDLLGATSPNTPVDTNWRFSIEIMRRFMRGEFNRELEAFDAYQKTGAPLKDFPKIDKIKQASGKLYGMNSNNAAVALLDMWRIIKPGSAPKARNFALNLIGQSNMATIDVWAARMLRRATSMVPGVDLPRIPPPAEKGVTGKWNADATSVTGEFGFGARVMELVSEDLVKKGYNVTPPDLQAIAWFAEKELWGQKGWTTKTGEGGSFEENIEAMPTERYIAGWSIQQGEKVPEKAKASVAQARVMAMLNGDDSVIAARVMPTYGLYGGTVEASFDTEWTAHRGKHDPSMVMAEIAKIAEENSQYDIFVSKAVAPGENNPNARPGVEIFFRDKRSLDAAMPVLEAFTSKGQDGFTMAVDPRAKLDGGPGDQFIGVRLQYVPEISMRWDDELRASLKQNPDSIIAILEEKEAMLDEIANQVAGMDGVAYASAQLYDTVVVGKENYSDYVGRIAGAQDQAARNVAWFGRTAREAVEGAVARLEGERRQVDAGRVPDAGGAAAEARGEVKFSRAPAPNTPEFKKWFAGSKVVDEKGEPMVVYHGTTKDFERFDLGAERNMAAFRDAQGFYFTKYPSDASAYTEDSETGDPADGSNVMPVYLSMKNPLRVAADDVDNHPAYISAARRAKMEAQGYDGIIYADGVEYVVFESAQVKSIFNDKPTEDPRILFSRKPFYSALIKSVEAGTMAKKGSAAAYKQWLDGAVRRGEFKQNERDWMGVDEWLDSQKGQITKQDLVEFVRANEVQIDEVVLGAEVLPPIPRGWRVVRADGDEYNLLNDRGEVVGVGESEREAIEDGIDPDEAADSPESMGAAKYQKYKTQGGKNYRELLLTLPASRNGDESQRLAAAVDEAQAEYDRTRSESAYRALSAARERARMLGAQQTAQKQTYRSSHWDQPNVLAHMRFNERVDADGNRVLFIQEIQSDWHQDGRKKGYGGKPMKGEVRIQDGYDPASADMFEPEGDGQTWAVYWEDGTFSGGYGTREQAEQRLSSASAAKAGVVPDAPLKATDEWAMLAFKRAARWAVENGFDRIAWATGEMNAEVFGLQKDVERIQWHMKFDDSEHRHVSILLKNEDEYNLRVDSKGRVVKGFESGDNIDNPQDFSGNPLSAVIGEEVAAKIMGAENGTLSGNGLKAGGSGMKGFYDDILPKAVNKWAKKFDAKVGQTKIDLLPSGSKSAVEIRQKLNRPDYGTAKAHSLDITPDMREAVMQGQPLFSRRQRPQEASERLSEIGTMFRRTPAADEILVPGGASWLGGKVADARPTWLKAMTRQQIVEVGKDQFKAEGGNLAEEFEKVARRLDADATANVTDPIADGRRSVQKIAENWASLSSVFAGEKKRQASGQMAALMHDATLAGIDPAKEMAEGADEAKYRELRRRWDALPKEFQSLYIDARDAYSKRRRDFYEALKERIAEAQVDGKKKREMLDSLRQHFEAGRVKGVYFPLSRFGEYWVRAKKGDEVVEFVMTEREQDQRAEAQRLRAAGYTVTTGKSIRGLKSAMGPSAGFMGDISKLIDAQKEAGELPAGVADAITDGIWQMYLQTLPEQSVRKHFIHRKGTAGFSQDALRAFATQMGHGAKQLARVRHAYKMADLLQKMTRHATEQAPDGNKAADIVKALDSSYEWMMAPKDSGIAQWMTSLGFMWYLGVSPAAALINTTQMAMVTLPTLAAKHGWARSGAALTKATKDYANSFFNKNAKAKLYAEFNGDMGRALEDMERSGAIDRTMTASLMEISDTSTINVGAQKVMSAIGFLYHHAERLNRESTGIAAYRLARQRGYSHETAVEYGYEAIFGSHFDYSNANRAEFMRSNMAKVLLQFRQYSQNITYFMWRNLHQALKGESKEVRREAATKFFGTLGMTSLFAGAVGLPGYSMAMASLSAAHALFGDDDEPYDPEVEFRKWLAEHFGSAAPFLAKGAFNPTTGLDIAGRTGMGELWVRSPDVELEGKDLAFHYLEQAAGPSIGIFMNIPKAMKMLEDGQTERAAEQMVPKFVRDVLKAGRYAEEGALNMRGDPIVDQFSAWEIAGQSQGFSPAELSEQYAKNNAVKRAEQRILNRRQGLMNQWWMARQNGDQQGLAEAMQAIAKFNRRWPAKAITGDTLRSSMQSRQRYSRNAANGVGLDPKLRRELLDMTEY